MATHIKDIIETFLQKKARHVDDVAVLRKSLAEVLGEELASHITIGGIENTRLVLYTASSSVRYDCNLKQTQILEEIKKQYPYIESVSVLIK